MFLVSSCSCLRPVHWSHVLSQEWRCIWSSAYMGCTNYIWVINKAIACKGVSYIRGFRVHRFCYGPVLLITPPTEWKMAQYHQNYKTDRCIYSTLRPEQKGPHWADNIFQAHFLDSKCSYFGLSKGLLPDGTKPWPEPKSVYHQRGPMTFIRR